MVQILEEARLVREKSLKESEKEVRVGALPEPELELVSEARRLLKRHYEDNAEESARLYSQYHYDELMEPDAPHCCWRYILHSDKNVAEAVEMMKRALVWRKENNIDTTKPTNLIKDLWLRSALGFVGKTMEGDDLAYVIARNYRKPDPSIKGLFREFVASALFEWDRTHRYDLAQYVIVYDIRETGYRNIDVESVLWNLSLREYLPSRVKAVYIVGMNMIMRPVVNLIISRLPDKIRRTTHCVSMEQFKSQVADEHNMPEDVGGKAPNTWRLAPAKARWIYESDVPEWKDVLDKISEAISFNVKQEKLVELYEMQREYDRKCASAQ